MQMKPSETSQSAQSSQRVCWCGTCKRGRARGESRTLPAAFLIRGRGSSSYDLIQPDREPAPLPSHRCWDSRVRELSPFHLTGAQTCMFAA